MRVPVAVNHPEARAVTDGDIILATVNVTAPPERVFRALFSDETERWWGAPGTRVTVRQEDFGHSQPAYEHAAGWERFLEWLAAYLKEAK